MIQQLRNKIKTANELYRLGTPVITDSEYDNLLEQLKSLSPNDKLLNKVGHVITDDRKSKLPIEMASMNKIKTIEDIQNWARLKSISPSELVIITPKFDGLSLCVDEVTEEAWTRGDGSFGQKSDAHYKLINNHLWDLPEFIGDMSSLTFKYTYGEVMLSKKIFNDKYSSEFANPRNLVAGLINSKTTSEILKDCNYIKYGGVFPKSAGFKTKKEVLVELNKGQEIKVDFFTSKISELTEDLLISLFHKWSTDYEIDGLIIEIDNLELQSKLGRETSSNNPVWARAFKHESFEQTAETVVTGITWNISKQGYLKPILHVNPVRLDGVTVSNVTGNNARFVKDSGIGIGAEIVIKRSGMVIPLVVSVTKTVEFQYPYMADPNGMDIPYMWNENEIELVTMDETDDQKLKKLVAFFEILEAKNISEGTIRQLWDSGYKTIKDILSLTTKELEQVDRFGKRKASIVYESIKKSITGVSLSKLQHATGIFNSLGSKKLLLLEQFTQKPTIEEVMSIDGFAETSANVYVDNYDRFFDFVKDLPITIESTKTAEKISNDFEGLSFVFTGVRLKKEEDILVSRGAKIGSGVSKTTTHLVCKDPNSGSSKLEKAKSLGVKIIGVDELQKMLK